MKHLLVLPFLLLSLMAMPSGATASDATHLEIQLEGGAVLLRLRPDLAPRHVGRIVELADAGFYDGVVFHRVISGFMAQTGDPTGTGRGGSGQKLVAEFSAEPFRRGTVGMARARHPDSADSQFFICFADASFLNGPVHGICGGGRRHGARGQYPGWRSRPERNRRRSGPHDTRALRASGSRTMNGTALRGALAGILLAAGLGIAAQAAQEPPADWKREWPNTDFSASHVSFGEILSGGPPKDGIPAIDRPRFVPANESDGELHAREPVMTLIHRGTTRAYPDSLPDVA